MGDRRIPWRTRPKDRSQVVQARLPGGVAGDKSASQLRPPPRGPAGIVIDDDGEDQEADTPKADSAPLAPEATTSATASGAARVLRQLQQLAEEPAAQALLEDSPRAAATLLPPGAASFPRGPREDSPVSEDVISGQGHAQDAVAVSTPSSQQVAVFEVKTAAGAGGPLPHGGQLVTRQLDVDEAAELATSPLPSLSLTVTEVAELRALATGAYSPLVGFMGAEEHQSVIESMRLPDGTLWPIPVCLGIPEDAHMAAGRVLLRGEGGELLGVLWVHEVFERDRELEAELVYGTTNPAHPGVARLLAAPRLAAAGPIQAVIAPLTGPVGARALTPAETRAAFQARGWATVVGFQTRNPVHRAHEYLIKWVLLTFLWAA